MQKLILSRFTLPAIITLALVALTVLALVWFATHYGPTSHDLAWSWFSG
jgi:hypothetical protein